ncbi:MAG: penicillin-binding protein 2 [Eggerthellaceae bacterium]|nr:penicillin-binding protein 2 [Eggerthellaceae bacterium]
MSPDSSGFRSTGGKRPSTEGFERYVSRGSNRAFVVILVFLVIAAGFLVRLLYLQVIVSGEYSARAEESRTVGFTVEPRRGTIYDRNGHILAISVDATTVYANPSEVKEPASTSRAIAEALGGNAADYAEALEQSASPTFSFIARKADTSAAARLKEQNLPGIYFIDDTRREYPYGQTGGQVIGACSVEVDSEANREYYVGICGLEMFYDTTLSGTAGYYEAEVGADGTPIPGGVHESKRAVEGQDIIVSLDIEFQEELERDLKNGVKRVGVNSGSAVVMDAKTGEIYAAASSPFFNPADRSEVPEGSMQLKAATNLFEPGSIFKTVSATAILEEGTMTPDTEVDCPSYLEADGYIVSDAWYRGEEKMTLRDIINRSSNVGISLSVENNLGFQKLYDAIVKYRLNTLTGIDYPGEQVGYLLDFDYWSRVQGYNATFGQGLSVNAFQMLAFYGALMNDGVSTTPHFLMRKPQTNETPTWETHQIIDNKDAIAPMKSMLQTVVTDGTATDAEIEGYKLAGKTSTAEIFDEENGGYRLDVYNIAFAGFIDESTSNFVCFCGADEVPGDRKVTTMFHDIMYDAINRYNIVSLASDE